MGITNKNGALYLATGIDNTGLYKGRQEAIGIIKAMTQEITSFDVFGGIGISAGIAFAKAAADSYKFEKQFQQSMKEVATLSSGIKGSLADWMNQVSELTTRIPIGAIDAAKALYQIVSAGHDGADGMRILEESAKAAVGGVTDTATAADAITTVLNAYKQGASEAGKVSDYLFTTVKLGKTDFTQLGQSVAQVAPIAASYGVEMDQVLAAVASLTKQGTPTAQAMTQIRAAIIGTSKVLGDGAYEGRTFQDALNKVADMAGGSESKLRELMPEIEGVNGLLGLTGRNAKTAAQDLESIGNSTGAASDAYKEMLSSVENQIKIFSNNITNALRPLGSAILKQISEIAQSFNEAFESGKVEESVKMLGETITVVTSAFIAYKGAIAASTIVASLHKAVIEIVRYEVTLYKAAVAAGTIAENANTLAQIKNKAVRMAMINTIKIHTAALTRNAAALAANPYTLAAAAIGALGYALYNTAKGWDESADGVKKYQKESKETVKKEAEHRTWLERLIKLAGDDSLATKDRIKALDSLKAKYPPIFAKYKTEAEALEKIYEWKSKIIILDGKQNLQDRKTKIDNLNTKIEQYDKSIKSASSQGAGVGVMSMVNERNNLIKERDLLKKDYENKKAELKKHTEQQDGDDNKSSDTTHNKAYWEAEKKKAQDFLDKLSDIDAKGKKGEALRKMITGYDKKINLYSATSTSKDEESLRKETDKYNVLLDNQALEKKRFAEDLQNQVNETRIKAMDEGSAKTIAEMELNFEKEMRAIDRQKEDALRKKIDDARSAFESNPKNAKKSFDGSNIKLSDDENRQFDELYKSGVESYTKQLNEKKKLDDWSMDEYLIKYGSFNQKKQAIDKQYEEAISKAGNQGEKNILQKEWEEAVSSLNMDRLKQNINWELIFGDLSKVSKKNLDDVKQQLKAFKNSSEYKTANVEQKKIVDEALNNVQTAIIDKGGLLGDLPEQLDALRVAQDELAIAQNEYNEALKGGTETEIEEALKKKNNAENNVQNAETNVTKSSDKTTQNLITLSDTITQLGNSSEMSLSQIGGLAENIVDIFAESGSKIGGIVGAAFSLLDAIDKQGLDGFVENIFSSLFKANTSVWDTVTFGAFSRITGSGESDEYLERDLQNLEQSNQDLKNALDNLSDKMDKASITDANDIYEVQKANIQKMEANKQQEIQRSGDASDNGWLGVGGSHSSNYKINKGMSSSDWIKISNIVGKSVGSASDFFELSSKEMAKLAEDDTTLYSKIKNLADDGYKNAAQYMDEYITYYKQLEELENSYNEKLTDTSFDSLRDEFKNALLDMESDADDFTTNFEKMMQNAIVESLMTKKYDKLIQAWYDDFAKAMENDGMVDKDEQSSLKKQWDDIVAAGLAERDALKESMNWDSSSSTQNSTSKGFNTMSQETGEELNGRFTAFQISSEECKNQLIIQSGLSADQVRILQELYKMSYNYYEQRGEDMTDLIDILNAIKKDTGNLPDMKRSLDAIERNTSRL